MTALTVDTAEVPPLPDEFVDLGKHLEAAHPEAEWTDVLRLCWVLSFGQKYLSGVEVISGLIIRDWLIEEPAGPIIAGHSGMRYRLSDEGRRVARTVPR